VASAPFEWRSRYAGWPALKKLEYVDALMTEIAGQPPLLSGRDEVDPLNRLTETLGEHYRKNRLSTPSMRPQPTTVICCGCSPPIQAPPVAVGFDVYQAQSCENSTTCSEVDG